MKFLISMCRGSLFQQVLTIILLIMLVICDLFDVGFVNVVTLNLLGKGLLDYNAGNVSSYC